MAETHNIKAGDMIRTVYDNHCNVLKVNAKSVRVRTQSGFETTVSMGTVRTLNPSRFV